ncbi:MAG: AMP-binding protein [Solirubrobacteraceae bacterium]|nr:AMP-binding protein [Solirubrobacteraceae bacterium]
MPGRKRTSVVMAAGAVRALSRAGVVRPVAPDTLRRVGGARHRLRESLASVVAIGAARWPDRVALSDDRGAVTYGELHRRGAALAAGLQRDLGVGPDRSLAILARNHNGAVEAAIAAGRLGADLLLLNTDFAGPQLADVLKRERPGAIAIDEEFLPALGFTGPSAPPAVVAWHDAPQTLPTLESFASAPLTGPPPLPTRTSRLTILTSGTTGRPKGARRAIGATAMAGVVASALDRTGLRSGDPVFVAVPLFHGYGFALAVLALVLGCPLSLRRRFEPEAALALVDAERLRMMAVVPVMLKRMLDVPLDVAATYDRASLEIVLSGAAPLDPVLADRTLRAWGPILYNGYGSSEAGVATLATPEDLHDDPSSVGRPVLGTTIRILDDDHQQLPPSVTGHVFVDSSLAFDGYTGEEGRGRKAVVDGMVATGDMGHLDIHGRLSISGREDDMILSGGENVYPQEIEDVLHEHEGIADVAVLGVHDPEFGQRLAAYVVCEEGEFLGEEEIRSFVRERLARYKVPRDVVFIDELPRTATGKVRRRALPGP